MMGHMFQNGGYSGNWTDMPENMRQMMQGDYGGFSTFGSLYGLMHLITWALLIALLLGVVRWVWRKGDKVR